MSIPRPAVYTLPIHRRPLPTPRRLKAFSLVEVVLAIGVMSFAMMAVLGTLPVGLKSTQESRGQVAAANIARQIQGELQQLSFRSDSTDTLTIETLADESFFFTLEGTRTDASEAYYEASFAVSGVSLPGLTIAPANAQSVTVTLSHPVGVAHADRQQTKFALLLAKQKTD